MLAYNQIAEWYAATRDPEIGVPDLANFVRRLAPGTRILDLGCGHGIPISQFLTRRGFELVGLDSSPEMIERYRANLPGVATRCEPIQQAYFAANSFDAVVAWGVLFHLSKEEQRAACLKVSKWLKPGGRFLFTAGDVEGEREGEMNGVVFRYVSLYVSAYSQLLERAGLTLESVHSDAWDNCVYTAEKAA